VDEISRDPQAWNKYKDDPAIVEYFKKMMGERRLDAQRCTCALDRESAMSLAVAPIVPGCNAQHAADNCGWHLVRNYKRSKFDCDQRVDFMHIWRIR
jgi:hypothetical protein